DPRGARVHRVELPRLSAWAVASARGTAACLDTDNQLRLVCLRVGRVFDSAASPLASTVAIETDAAGTALLVAGAEPDGHVPLVHLGYSEAFGPGARDVDPSPAPTPEPAITASA